MSATRTISLLGGTGPEGKGLAARFAAAGEQVVIGSRSAERAKSAADEVGRLFGEPGVVPAVSGVSNQEAAREGTLVFLCVPFSGQAAVLSQCTDLLADKIAVSVVAPITFANGKLGLELLAAGSAVEEAAKSVPNARWVAGFHTLPARDLARVQRPMETDALICSDDDEAKHVVMALAEAIEGLRAVDAGPLTSARYLEAATALLININRIHRTQASLRIVGLRKT